MSQTLSSWKELRHAFFRLVGAGPADSAFAEHDEADGDTVNAFIQQGLWDAQSWWLSNVDPSRWVTTSSALSWSGADATGGRYTSLPTDLLRIYGTKEVSAIRESGGDRWGQLIDPEDRDHYGDLYYLLDGELWICRGANPPSGVVLDYNHRHDTYTESTDESDATWLDFPIDGRKLVVGYAAKDASLHPMFPGDESDRRNIGLYLRDAQTECHVRGRRTRESRKVRSNTGIGNRFLWKGR